MNQTTRTSIITSIVIIVVAGLYLIWFYNPAPAPTPANTDPDEPGSVNYLDEEPVVIPGLTMSEGDEAPDFSFYTIDNEEITLSDYFGEKYVLIDFWSIGCSPCLRELPLLQQFYESHSDQVEIIAVTGDAKNRAETVRERIVERDVAFPVVHDHTGEISSLYPTRFIPYLVFVDIDGTVITTHTGEDPEIADTLIEMFDL